MGQDVRVVNKVAGGTNGVMVDTAAGVSASIPIHRRPEKIRKEIMSFDAAFEKAG